MGTLIQSCPSQVLPKPNRAAQQFYDGTKRVAFTENIFAKEKSTEVERSKNTTDRIYIGFIAAMHILCLALPFTFSWSNVALFGATYFITGCLGITLSFHRQLAHKSFRTPKWLEYLLAYCGALAVQGDPKEWVSTHRCACSFGVLLSTAGCSSVLWLGHHCADAGMQCWRSTLGSIGSLRSRSIQGAPA